MAAAGLADFGTGPLVLTRFTGRLNAAQMASDRVLVADATDEAYRETR